MPFGLFCKQNGKFKGLIARCFYTIKRMKREQECMFFVGIFALSYFFLWFRLISCGVFVHASCIFAVGDLGEGNYKGRWRFRGLVAGAGFVDFEDGAAACWVHVADY